MWTVSEKRLISVKETVLTNAERCISAWPSVLRRLKLTLIDTYRLWQYASKGNPSFLPSSLIEFVRLRKPSSPSPLIFSPWRSLTWGDLSVRLWPPLSFLNFSSSFRCSHYAGGMKEQDLMCIKLHGVNRIGLKKIIDFIYTAKLSLNMENLQDTLEAASFLQILPVLDFCKVFLISGVSKCQPSCSFTHVCSFSFCEGRWSVNITVI